MSYKSKTLGVMIVLAGMAAWPFTKAKADDWNKETGVTLSAPLEVPGRVLPPGNYVFQLADSPVDRSIVQIFNEDKTQIIATIAAIPAYRLEPSDSTLITREVEEQAGRPEALSRWFFAGDLSGVAFLYPPDQR
jgi:hypothetical protein